MVNTKVIERRKHQNHFWDWLRDKVMPSMTIVLCAGVFATYVQIVRLIDAHETTKSQLTELKQEVAAIKREYVQRLELLEILKRVEQQLEINRLQQKSSYPSIKLR